MSFTPDRWSTHWDAGHNWALVLAAGKAVGCIDPDAERVTRTVIERLADYVWLLLKPSPQ